MLPLGCRLVHNKLAWESRLYVAIPMPMALSSLRQNRNDYSVECAECRTTQIDLGASPPTNIVSIWSGWLGEEGDEEEKRRRMGQNGHRPPLSRNPTCATHWLIAFALLRHMWVELEIFRSQKYRIEPDTFERTIIIIIVVSFYLLSYLPTYLPTYLLVSLVAKMATISSPGIIIKFNAPVGLCPWNPPGTYVPWSLCIIHRRSSSVNLRARHFPDNISKINKIPNVTRYLPEKCPNFTWKLPEE